MEKETLLVDAVECDLCIDDPTGESCDCKNMTQDEIEAAHAHITKVYEDMDEFELASSKFVLGIDPGHEGVISGLDPGAIGFGLKEAEVVLNIALEANKYMKENFANAEVVFTRTGNQRQSVGTKASLMNSKRVTATVSIHNNAFKDPNANGYEDFSFNGPISSISRKLQDCVHSEMVKALPELHVRGKKRANLGMLRLTNHPAVLVEVGFITNKRENDLMKNTDFIKRSAKGIVEGVALAFGLRRIKTAAPQPKPTPAPSKPSTPSKPTRDQVAASVSASLKDDVLKAFDLGITDGSRPSESPTRAHVMAMMGRLAKLIEDGTVKSK